MVKVNTYVGLNRFENVCITSIDEKVVAEYQEREKFLKEKSWELKWEERGKLENLNEKIEWKVLSELERIVNEKVEGLGIDINIGDWEEMEYMEFIVE